MILSLIAALDKNHLIGRGNALPWHLPADLRHFKATTMGKPIIMGRKTFESIGKALPGRLNIVVTRQPGYTAAGCVVAGSLAQALQAAAGHDEAFVIGGAALYREAIRQADRLYLTFIEAEFAGDTYFPAFEMAEWQEIDRRTQPPDEKNPYVLAFVTLQRR